MFKLKYFLTLCQIIFLCVSTNAQYKLQTAFPNLPPFSLPLALVHADDGTNRLFVAQQRGIIYVFDNSSTVSTRKVFINLSSKVSQTGAEAGLLGLTFHPQFEKNKYFYVHYVFDSTGSPSNQWVRIARYTASSVNPDSALISTEQILFTISLPDIDHNGGQLTFGPDNFLYISVGDAYSIENVAQDRTKILGKILRINIDSAANGRNYSIPVTNPYFGNTLGFREEIFAYGFRNPWRFSFDPITGRIWSGDAGQVRYEEVDIIEIGKNYGWNNMEGFHCFPDTTMCDTTGRGFTLPIWEFTHVLLEPYVVVGGYVFRGDSLPALYGKYIYADFGHGTIWALTYNGTGPATNELILDADFLISSFGIDQHKNLYICRYSSSNGVIYRLRRDSTIEVKKISGIIPDKFYLHQNFPNPFNPSTTINYDLPNAGLVTLKVFDVSGKEVTILISEMQKAGSYSVTFDGTNLPSGIYFYKFHSGINSANFGNGFTVVKRMVLIR